MNNINIQQAIAENLRNYFDDLDGQQATNIYQMIVNVVEQPMLKVVLEKANYNQSKAANMLGLNRNTLRKKLKAHNML